MALCKTTTNTLTTLYFIVYFFFKKNIYIYINYIYIFLGNKVTKTGCHLTHDQESRGMGLFLK